MSRTREFQVGHCVRTRTIYAPDVSLELVASAHPRDIDAKERVVEEEQTPLFSEISVSLLKSRGSLGCLG